MRLIPGYAQRGGTANSVYKCIMVPYLDIQHLTLN